MKKLCAHIALSLIISLMLVPVTLADEPANQPATSTNTGTASEILNIANPFEDINKKRCINEFKILANGEIDPNQTGPDHGFITSIMEEPLFTEYNEEYKYGDETKGETIKFAQTSDKDRKYITRRCYRNNFQYTNPDTKKVVPVSMLALTCSDKAQKLFTNADKKYKISYTCKEVQVILSKGGTSSIYGYIGMIYKWGASVVGIVAVTVIILSGIQISASGGDSEAINAGKKRIIQSIVGIVVLFLSSLILYTINPNFFTK